MSYISKNITHYYTLRAKEYEKIYQRPERQSDIKKIIHILQNEFRNRKVLEIACGTGYWTRYISETATMVQASDINEPVLKVAKSKNYPGKNVSFATTDFYQIAGNDCDSIFGGFIWSHIPQQTIDVFLKIVHSKIKEGKILFLDNIFVEGSSTPVAESDDHGNTYQKRQLSDDTTFLILKNFPPADEITGCVLRNNGKDINLILLKYYWIVSYEI